ncbi:hypothetical protein TorRG33x02_250760 [Trema orientale]|uniref:RNase H type-1 domain-containing protein n=1 Tax=Trema orientale TaxID=63057 RepID=A0A2P5DHZ0_TREOI|nr:hypothetical protein TorRG33x02_250760 [Trema orientale]
MGSTRVFFDDYSAVARMNLSMVLEIIQVVVNDRVAEFVAAREQPRSASLPCPTWLPASEGWIKINMDVYVQSSGSITAAMVRDHTGKIISAFANRVNFTDAQVVEAASLLDGIRLALDQNYNYVVLEGDCSQVYQGLLGDMENIGWDVRSLLLDSQHFLQSIGTWEVSVIARSANFGAHNLAKWCYNNNALGFINCNLVPGSVLCMDLHVPF